MTRRRSTQEQIVAKDPENATMWLMIAQIDLQNGKFEEGKEALSHVPDEKITDPNRRT